MPPLTLSFVTLLFTLVAAAQQSNNPYTLQELISIAYSNSPRAEQLELEKKIASGQYNFFKRTGRPLIAFNGNIPVYNKDNFAVVQPDGSLVFRSRSQSNSDANFSIEQTFPSTNSKLSLNTYLNRYDDYFAKKKSYNGTLFYIQLRQPLFSFNQYKWDKRIEPMRYNESKLVAATAGYELALLVCQYYYDVIEAEADMELAKANYSYAAKNRAAEQRRKELGASTDDKLLQLQMMELEATAGMEQSMSRVATAKSALSNFIGLQELRLSLRMPDAGSTPAVSTEQLISSAERTNPVFLAAKRELLEAQSATDRVKAEGRQVNVVGSFGVTNTGGDISALFVNPNDQQRFSIGLQVPIYDGGRRKQKLAIARENEKLVLARSKQDVILLLNEIIDIHNEYDYVRSNIGRLKLLDSLGEQRFIISNRLFETGKIPVMDVQLSQREKDMGRRNYLRALRRLSELKYEIRAKTGMVIE